MAIKLVWKWELRGFYSGVKTLERCTSTTGKCYQLQSWGNSAAYQILQLAEICYSKWRNAQALPKGQIKKRAQLWDKDLVCIEKPHLVLSKILTFFVLPVAIPLLVSHPATPCLELILKTQNSPPSNSGANSGENRVKHTREGLSP